MYVSSPMVLTSAGDMLCAGHVTRDTWYLPWLDLTGLDSVAVAALRRGPVKQMLTAENGQITSNSNNLTYNNSSTKINREQIRNQYAK